LAWLQPGRSVVPDALPLDARAELGQRWADASKVRFDAAEFHPLLFFSGGRPGMALLLLGASHKLLLAGKPTANDTAYWLHTSDWDRITDLASNPGPGLPSIEVLVDELVDDLSSTCDATELTMIRTLSRFQVCCEEVSVARLMTSVSGSEVSAEAVS